MTETIHDRIKSRLAETGLSQAAASQKAGLSRDAIRKLLTNEGQLPTGKTLTGLAAALETSEQWLLTGGDRPPVQDVRPADIEFPARSEMPKDVAVLGTAAGSHERGAFQLSSDPIEYVRRPPALVGARDIYSLYVEGSSMEPQFWPGDLVYVHPHRHPRTGDAVVVQSRNEGDDSTVEATIGLYVEKTPDSLVIRKHNPPAEIEIPSATISAYHKVLTLNELFGV
ncbi:S24 family peptidase [Ensifer sp. LCM 4579]|uniref:XRE family transcriptional regulator n=1 Tax=Ensifer sp. LCM 4579 TaxID=1848292 RepID=UPI0008DA9495|nr:S24 family peptidase [Ensifer sp. LCM 4579]OHV73352.1 repressor [Ensifer sp. LCM 4579]